MEYKRLGDYIREVNVRNRDLKVTNLLGVSISKEFMPSIANTIGTDMSTYKIVERGQFAYGPVTSRNGDKVSIALLDGYDDAIISQAYTVFEVVDHEQLLPEYLMMWFRRPEFDRYARFHSHGSAREIFDWDELCDVMLPIPSITRQREIVSEYETLANRIRLNNQMIQYLEATAQALYRKTFVDNIDKENLPEGWRMGIIDNICEVKDGTHDSPKPIDVGNPLITSVHLNPWSVSLESAYFISAKDYRKICERSLVETGDILMSMIGTIGIVNYVLYEKVDFAVKNMAIFKTSQNSEYVEYVLFYLKSNEMKQYIAESTSGSTQGYVTLNTLRCMQIIIPDEYIIKEYHCITKELISHIWNLTKEDLKLTELQSLLLAKMGQ